MLSVCDLNQLVLVRYICWYTPGTTTHCYLVTMPCQILSTNAEGNIACDEAAVCLKKCECLCLHVSITNWCVHNPTQNPLIRLNGRKFRSTPWTVEVVTPRIRAPLDLTRSITRKWPHLESMSWILNLVMLQCQTLVSLSIKVEKGGFHG
jgi:hypothetical protein